jgi:predicted metal-dependent hydrolase
MQGVEIRRSARARRWRLEARWGEPVRLVVPQGMTVAEIERVLADGRMWIERQRRRQVPCLGLERLAVSEADGRKRARQLVSALAEEEAGRIGVSYRRIRIGAQRTRWGSCSPRGTLSFNWRLVLAPPDVADYVVVHELCHLRVPNHSRSFWKLVEQHRPHWRDQRAWLREHGAELLGFKPGCEDSVSPTNLRPSWASEPEKTPTAEVSAISWDEIIRVERDKIEQFVALGLGRFDAISAVDRGIDWRAVKSLVAERGCSVTAALEIAR